MGHIDSIKADLPNIPEDALVSWLAPMAEGMAGVKGKGWPPPEDDLGDWRYVLLCKSLDFWRKTEWEIEKLNFLEAPFIGPTSACMMQLAELYAIDRPTGYEVAESKPRIARCLDYLLNNRTFPVRPIFLRGDDSFSIIDGNHRNAALLVALTLWKNEAHAKAFSDSGLLQISPIQEVWMVTPPAEDSYVPDNYSLQIDEEAAAGEEYLRQLKKKKPSLRIPAYNFKGD